MWGATVSGVCGNDKWSAMAQRTTHLRGLVGSTVHGTHLPGTDDRDEMAVCIEDYEAAFGVGAPFEQSVYRSAAIREGRQDARSGPGDLDLTTYSLRKYLRLALQGNPTILLLLFVPPALCEIRTAIGARIQELAPAIASKQAGPRFLGFMRAQRERLEGKRGQKRVKRPELEEAHGYDVKYAGHIIRLGYQGIEFMETGRLQLPMHYLRRATVLDIRQGRVPLEAVLKHADSIEADLVHAIERSHLPPEPDVDTVEEWMLDVYLEHWKCRQMDRRIAAGRPF